jgi:hypothetical protein
MLTILLSLLSMVTAAAYSIQADQLEWQSGKEAITNCRAAGHGDRCDGAISLRDRLDPLALEGCLTFKSEEDTEVKSDDDIAQYQIRRGGFARYGQCLTAVKNRVFHPKAASVCGAMNDFLQHLECLGAIADQPFHGPSVESCLKLTYQSTVQGMECLRSIRGRVLSDSQRKKCETAPFQKRAECYRSSEQRELASCQAGLGEVETKLEALSSTRASGRDLKKTLAPVLEAIRDKLQVQQGAQ